ncbi:type I restriction endonuclease [Pedobacter sp. R-06]|uniref:type I restriction endonuclease n=1 Tax=Pedobacter sp. R-06 TaxID=3404051 RepID=UPI003CEA12B0
MINESEFETQVSEVLKNVFPTLLPTELSQQRSFKIKFGHHNVLIDGKEPTNYAKRSIYDILIQYKGKPFAMLELKKPGIGITEDEIDQGISYARLTEEITPITIISNGSDTRILNTYTKEMIDLTTFDAHSIDKIFRAGLRLASNAVEDSINNLLENDQRIMFDMINTVTADSFSNLTGSYKDFGKPIISEFAVDRSMGSFKTAMEQNLSVFLTGDRYCGKTNYLFQLFKGAKLNGHAFHYCDCNEVNYSIFRKLSIFLTREVGVKLPSEKIRSWLLLGLKSNYRNRLIICYDHLQFSTNPEITMEIAELTDIFRGTENQIILVSDNSNYDKLCGIDSTSSNTFYISRFKRIKLKMFSMKEFERANDLFFQNFQSYILPGGEYSGLYRNPRIWRLLAINNMEQRPEWPSIGVIKAVPSSEFITLISERLVTNNQTNQDLRYFTEAYVDFLFSNNLTGDLSLMAMNFPVMDELTFNRALSQEARNRLLETGIIERQYTRSYDNVYIPKIPEMMLKFCVRPMSDKLLHLFETEFDTAYNTMIKICQFLPYGEIIAAKIIADYCISGKDLLVGEIFNKLITDLPVLEKSKDIRSVGIYLPNYGFKEMDVSQEEEQTMMANFLPYLILSHLVGYSFNTSGEDPDEFNLKCLEAIGHLRFQIRPLHPNTIMEAQPETLTADSIGDLANSNVGITEPIVQSIQAILMQNPGSIRKLFDLALSKKVYPLIYRIFLGAKYTKDISSGVTEEVCNHIIGEYLEQIYKMVAFGICEKGASRDDIRRKEKEIKKNPYFKRHISSLS